MQSEAVESYRRLMERATVVYHERWSSPAFVDT